MIVGLGIRKMLQFVLRVHNLFTFLWENDFIKWFEKSVRQLRSLYGLIIAASGVMFLIDYYRLLFGGLLICAWVGYIVIVAICSYQITSHWGKQNWN